MVLESMLAETILYTSFIAHITNLPGSLSKTSLTLSKKTFARFSSPRETLTENMFVDVDVAGMAEITDAGFDFLTVLLPLKMSNISNFLVAGVCDMGLGDKAVIWGIKAPRTPP